VVTVTDSMYSLLHIAATLNHVIIMFVLILSHVLLYPIMHFSVLSFTNNLSDFFFQDLPVVRISPDGLQAHSKANPVVGLLPVISGPACFRMPFPLLLTQRLYCSDSVIITLFVGIGCTTRCGRLLIY